MAAAGETSADTVKAVSLAIDRYGVPLKLLSDNGTALNPSPWLGRAVNAYAQIPRRRTHHR